MAILTDAPAGADVFDVSSARAARAEARAKSGAAARYIRLSAGYVEVEPEVALSVITDLDAGEIERGLKTLVADPDDAKLLLAEGITMADLQDIVRFVSGADVGESGASQRS